MKLTLRRIDHDSHETIGVLTLHSNGKLLMVLTTIERAFDGFPKIKKGKHVLIKYYSPRFQKYLWKFNNKDEEDRYFEIHYSNFYTNLNGCVAVGRSFSMINTDDEIDITDSKSAFRELMKHTKVLQELDIEII